ncbi:hypothetical protein ACDY96_22940 [Rhizobium mongolense]|uniref:hypothetical protein n=1 Tax=Rhizobium TaxID=379 RepID=UPI00188FFC4B|nr:MULTISPECIES: hypothetical protein [unclassified Rhizobium]QPB22220.1 hypothetical protein ISN39_21370 [Rhizobium sp. 007]WFU90852.1 hypothetical protein QA644_21505 [Rhizobium sp. CC1099]
MRHHEMTVAEILNDPLIGQMMRADCVSVEQLEKRLGEAATRQSVSEHFQHVPQAAEIDAARARP